MMDKKTLVFNLIMAISLLVSVSLNVYFAGFAADANRGEITADGMQLGFKRQGWRMENIDFIFHTPIDSQATQFYNANAGDRLINCRFIYQPR